MVILTMKIDVLPEKREELLLTILALVQSMREERGCLSLNAFINIEDGNTINLVEEWESREDLDNHFRSDRFGALLGAKTLLKQPLEIRVVEASYIAGMEAIEAARSM